MHNRAIRKWVFVFTLGVAVQITALRAQIFTAPLQASTTGTNSVDFEFRADGVLIATGNPGVGTLLTSDQGPGIRMLWDPGIAAFRVGAVEGDEWDEANLGPGSVAMGVDNLASGYYSLALGHNASAGGYESLAIGRNAHAFGDNSIAFGSFLTTWEYASIAMGFESEASENNSVAIGYFATSTGYCATAFGVVTTATGKYSTALGFNTLADSYGSFAVGDYNIGGGAPEDWVPTDPLFEVGNGTSDAPSDALLIRKDGSAAFQGPVTVAPSGDIPMYAGE